MPVPEERDAAEADEFAVLLAAPQQVKVRGLLAGAHWCAAVREIAWPPFAGVEAFDNNDVDFQRQGLKSLKEKGYFRGGPVVANKASSGFATNPNVSSTTRI